MMVNKIETGENMKSYSNVVLPEYILFQPSEELSRGPVVSNLYKLNPQLSHDTLMRYPEAVAISGNRIPVIWVASIRLASWIYRPGHFRGHPLKACERQGIDALRTTLLTWHTVRDYQDVPFFSPGTHVARLLCVLLEEIV